MSSETARGMGAPGAEESYGRGGWPPERPGRAAGAPTAAADAGADAEAQTRSKAAELVYQGTEIAGRATDRVRETAGHAAGFVRERTPDALPDTPTPADVVAHLRAAAVRAGHVVAGEEPGPVRVRAVRAASAARERPAPLIAGTALLAALLYLRRARGKH
ncbi:hypothetical protein GTW71_12195 [Streptomyces sp. SID6041]|nr:hypothetical protein [Streptomyces sp. SID6041]